MKRFCSFLGWLLVLGCLGVTWAQAPVDASSLGAAPAAGQVIKESVTLMDLYKAGGWIMYVLAVLSVIVVALIIYFVIVLRPGLIVPHKLATGIRSALQQGRMQEARDLCSQKATPLSAVALAGLDYVQSADRVESGLLKDMIEGEGGRQASVIQNQVQYLMDIATISPLVGLLGTVIGMLKSFNAVALDLAKAKPMLLAAGVSQSLVATMAGLIVAIPAMAAYVYFRNRASRMIARMETVSDEILALLMKKSS